MILLIDNYDSFSYSLFQLVGELEPDIRVIRNDALTVDQIRELSPDRIILSPGPGRPEDAGVIVEAAGTLSRRIPTLGVCLGHQAICAAYGARITYAKQLMQTAPVARYHSLAVDPDSLPDCLTITAVTEDGEIMGIRHREYPIYGVQFHPEFIMTPDGKQMLKNFIQGGNDHD